ncbi:hypothetical protein AQUCO_04200183v1 [Aquilegia coerulea]|uniref:Leucine-rich repeat-containing N-terminal plant-type domain-containing protein n=1 Tax=Aquilegia coerulea TaxID=218851 RepID=A0A2G5CPM3_AQUCA|nr:hypothetical protein AQUCO_04200183v1 [Aquilegia coerulea]
MWSMKWQKTCGAVEKLELPHMNLSGRVSEDIQQLYSLTALNICCNAFSLSLLKSTSSLTHLKNSDVSQNYFVGVFPSSIGRVEGLISINGSNNNFSGFLPEEVVNLTKFESLDFRGSLFEEPIPKSFKNLLNLKYLGLAGNNLTGRIPGGRRARQAFVFQNYYFQVQ